MDIAKAQVRVSPLTIETKSERGKSEGIISVKNISNAPIRVRVYAEPFTYNRNGLQILSANTPSNLAPYLQFSPRELTIQPSQTRRIRVISRLAPNLPEGEYRAVIFNETLSEETDATGVKVDIVSRIGVTFYVVKGNITSKVAVGNANFNSSQNQIQLLVRNSGKASTVTQANWTLRSGDKVIKVGKSTERTVIAEGERYILLHAFDKNKVDLAPGTYQLSGELRWGGKNKLPFNLNLQIPSQSANK